MTKFTNPLDNVRVASPCSANWDEMYGNNRQRHCGECKLNVYNLSEMSKQEAENLIMNTEGRLCARFYRRPDGTVITKDCPVGWQAFKKSMSRFWTATASIVLTALSGIGITAYMTKQTEDPVLMGAVAVENPHSNVKQPLMGKIASTKIDEPQMIMGDIAEPETGEIELKDDVKMGRLQ